MLRWLRVSAITNVSTAFFFAIAIFSAAACSRTAAQDAVANEPLAETESPPSIVKPDVVKPTPPPTLAENAPAADGTVSVVVEPVREASPPSPPQAPTTQPVASAAADLLSRAFEPIDASVTRLIDRTTAGAGTSSNSLFYSRPLSLLEALERSGDRARRLWITQSYWKVSTEFAMVRWAAESINRLELIAPGGDPHDRAALDVAVAAATADLADARAELIAAQQGLVDLVRLPIGEPLPWPVDRPLVGPYQTHFDAIFATRPATGRIRAIDRMLPSKHEALESRAAAVIAADTAMQMTETDHAKAKRPIESVLAAHAALVGQQREFIKVMRAYNIDIAEYVMAVADLTVSDDRFVSMLIATPIQWRASSGTPFVPPVPPIGATGQNGSPADGIQP